MDLWIRSTARTNLCKITFLTVMSGKKFYTKEDWEYKGYTIADCSNNGHYRLLGTYKTEKRALEVLDEIQDILKPKTLITDTGKPIECSDGGYVYMNQKTKLEYQQLGTHVYEMPQE